MESMDFSNMTINQLKRLSAEKGITIPSRLSKSKIIEKISSEMNSINKGSKEIEIINPNENVMVRRSASPIKETIIVPKSSSEPIVVVKEQNLPSWSQVVVQPIYQFLAAIFNLAAVEPNQGLAKQIINPSEFQSDSQTPILDSIPGIEKVRSSSSQRRRSNLMDKVDSLTSKQREDVAKAVADYTSNKRSTPLERVLDNYGFLEQSNIQVPRRRQENIF